MEFLITMTHEQADRAEQALASLGVAFQPRRNVVAVDDPGLAGRGITGTADFAAVTDAVNGFLRKEKGPLLPQDPEALDVRQMAELLNFGHTQFHWERGKAQEAYFTTVEGKTCREAIREGCPQLENLLTSLHA